MAAGLAGAIGPRDVPVASASVAASAMAVLALLSIFRATAEMLRAPTTSRPGAVARRAGSPDRARVATGLVVTGALAAAFVLHTSGGAWMNGASAITAPSVAAVPLLLGLAGGLVLARSIGLAARLVAGAVAARTRGLGLAHALRGIAFGGGGRDLVLVIVVVAVGSGVLAATIAGSIARAEASGAAAEVGADFRIAARSPAGLPVTLDADALQQIGPTAIVRTGSATISAQTLASTFVTVAAVDPAAYAAVTGGTLVNPALRDALARASTLSDAGATLGTQPTVGLVASSGIARRLDLHAGTRVTVSVTGQPAVGEVVAVLDELPGMPAGMDVVIPGAQIPAAATVPAEILLRAGPTAAPRVDAAVGAFRSLLVITSRQDALDRRHDGIIPAAIRDGFAVALTLAALLAGLAVLLVLATTETARRREALVLVLLGMPEAAARRLVVNQAILTVVIAAAAGLALGAGVAWLTVPDLGLEHMADVTGPVAAVVDPAWLAVAVAGPLAAAVVGLGIVSLTGARGGRRGQGGGAGLADEAARRLGQDG